MWCLQVVAAYYYPDKAAMHAEVNKYAIVFACLGFVSVCVYTLQHYFFGVSGEKLVKRVREKMLAGTALTHLPLPCVLLPVGRQLGLLLPCLLLLLGRVPWSLLLLAPLCFEGGALALARALAPASAFCAKKDRVTPISVLRRIGPHRV